MKQSASMINGNLCPLCHQSNGCAVEQGENAQQCWCKDREFPSQVLDQVPSEWVNKSCVCKTCLDKLAPLTINVKQSNDS